MTPPPSPRRRRLRLTARVLCVATFLGAGVAAGIYLKSRPTQYRPDETSADITSELAKSLPPDAPRPRFTDVTRAAGLADFRNFTGPRTAEMPEDIGPGVAWGDFDNDGDDDVFLVSVGGALNLPEHQRQPCALFENLGDGTFRRVESFPDLRIHGNAAAWGDCDGDGFLDLVVSGYNALRLFHNEPGDGGGRKFVRDERLPSPPGFWTGVSWGDYDNDRALDLYVCGYIDYIVAEEDRAKSEVQAGSMIPFTLNPASFKGGTNLLFHNNRDGTFTDVAAQLKVQNPEGRSLGALWHDFDDDGWLDLYVANDISDNVFYHNVGGRFEDISHPALVADYRSAMGLAAGDYDRDGDDDLFITHWVAQENALYDNLLANFPAKPSMPTPTGQAQAAPSLSPAEGERAAVRGQTGEIRNEPSHQTLAATNRSPLRFMDLADKRGLGQIALPYVGWGAEFVDLDADGWLDLVVANGNTIEEDTPPPKKLKAQDILLFWNRRGGHFHNLAPLHAGLSAPHVSRGLAASDFDNDGDMDFLIADLGEGVRLFRNEMQTGNWLKLRLRSRTANGQPLGFGDGAKVIAWLGNVPLRRTVSSVSFLSQSSRALHFGLGPATQVDRLEVRWLGGGTNGFSNLAANTTWEVTEGEPTPKTFSVRSPGFSRSAVSEGDASTTAPTPRPAKAGTPNDDKARLLEFWNQQRAAMTALKVEHDYAKAVRHFQAALALDPTHEDSRYYLAHCLVAQDDAMGALAQLQELQRLNPQSHRAFQQWGCLRALSATSDTELAEAGKSLERAHALNPEETGALLVLGEVSLLRGDAANAEAHLSAACRSNPKAVGGFFLRGYLAWKRGDHAAATKLLEDTRAALGKDWQPQGATSEGDVQRKQHVEKSPLARYWESWDGVTEPATTYAALEVRLRRQP
jgi:hypothetical protein